MKKALNGEGLRREIGWFSATILVIANMIGTGIFTTSGFIMAELQDGRALLLCWLGGGIFALCGALCYAELGARFPRAGGEYVFLREAFGKLPAFLSGWISLIVGFSAPIAAAALAFAGYAFQATALPTGRVFSLKLWDLTLATLSWPNLLALAVIAVFSLIHYHSLRFGSHVQNFLTLFKVILILFFIVAGLFLGRGSFSCREVAGGSWSAGSFAVSLIFVSFAYSGWNAAAYLGAEITRPQRNIPVALIVGTLVVMVFYMALNLVYLYAVPAPEMAGVMEIGARAATNLFGAACSRWFSTAIALGILSVLSAMIMTGPRIYYAMAGDGIFFPVFGSLNPEHRTPAASIFLQAGLAGLMVLSASFETLLIYIGFTLSLFASLTVLGLLRLRRRVGAPIGVVYRTWGYPVTPLLFILGNFWIIGFSLTRRPMAALIGLGTIAVGGVAYLGFTRRSSSFHSSRSGVFPGNS
jgi:APA family basic amino acid/polyamine antiporter